MNLINEFNVIAIQPELQLIVKALAKAIGPDIRTFISENDWDTYNSLSMIRSDRINTNLKNTIIGETMELRHFKRYVWTGNLLIDKKHKLIFTICANSTLRRIKTMKERKNPHYLQSMCHILNGDLEAENKQMSLSDIMGSEINLNFAEEVYEADFESIVDAPISQVEGYRHCLIVYETNNFELVSISLMILDKDLDAVREYSLMNLLQPDFGDLTAPIVNAEAVPKEQDAHSLIKVKDGLKSKNANEPEKKLVISTRCEEVGKQA